MPKIIENIRENLLEEAKRQVKELGYSAMTIRSVANACGVGVGTVYNYFSSKDMLVASFMLEDWEVCMKDITKGVSEAEVFQDALYCIHSNLRSFKEKYILLFTDKDAEAGYTASSIQRHSILRNQLAESLKMWTSKQTKSDANFLAVFIAESVLTWTMEDKEFEQIAPILLQLV